MHPVYPSTEKLSKRGISNRMISTLMFGLLEQSGNFSETLPSSIIADLKLMTKTEAMRNIHFPQSSELLAKAQFRLKFEEFFYIQLQLLRKNAVHKSKIKGFRFKQVGEYFNAFYNTVLPFELTGAQKRVLREIRKDLGSNAQMNRLLQGDVGSGKTIVALMSMLIAIDNGFQACLMAPT
jgi:ATP-dependent DNA helicase RecG